MQYLTRFVIVGVLCGVASSAAAQVVATDKQMWDQCAPALADANRYTYPYVVDATPGGPLTGVVCVLAVPAIPCSGAATGFTCTGNYPALTPGTHTVTMTANDGGVASLPSTPFTFQFTIVPFAPRNLRNVKAP